MTELDGRHLDLNLLHQSCILIALIIQLSQSYNASLIDLHDAHALLWSAVIERSVISRARSSRA